MPANNFQFFVVRGAECEYQLVSRSAFHYLLPKALG